MEPIIEAFRAYKTAQQDMLDAEELMSDPEMKELCQQTYQEAKAAKEAEAAAAALFGGQGDLASMPTTKIDALPISITDLLVTTKLAPSKGQARILIEQGGISIDDEKITDTNYMVEKIDEHIIIKKGKKTFHKVELA